MGGLGIFVGHVVKGIMTDVTKTTETVGQGAHAEPVQTTLGPGVRRVEITEEVEATAPRDGRPGQVITRRTTVEEVRIDQPPPSHRPTTAPQGADPSGALRDDSTTDPTA